MERNGAWVTVAKPHVDRAVPQIRELQARGVRIVDLSGMWRLPGRLQILFNYFARPIGYALQLIRLRAFLKRSRPELIVLSQGGCWDGFYFGRVLRRSGIPYVLICQKASDLYWPPDGLLDRVREFICGARHIYFVSDHNRRLLEEQIGKRIQSASVVRNPFLVDYDQALPWPSREGPIRLACVGRLYPMEKGQDLLLRVLATSKWKERDIEVSFFGEGVNSRGLQDMATLLGCRNVTFRGHVDNVTDIWATHHALVLPSRAEGLPLVLVEAMLAGRVAIVSRAGGSGEVVEDGKTAFLAEGYDEAGLDAALERAWQAREDWPMIGTAAAAAIRKFVSRDPAADLARDVERFLPAPTDTAPC